MTTFIKSQKVFQQSLSSRACPVCHQSNYHALFKPAASPGPVARCKNCSMVYISSIEKSHSLIFDGPVVYGDEEDEILSSCNLDDVSESWEFKNLPDKEAEWPSLKANSLDIIARIEQYMPPQPSERKILDFGSGWGFFLANAKEVGWDCYGLEPLPASAVYSRANFDLNITTDTLRADTFPAGIFDVITSFQVFEHLPFPEKDIQNLAKMLRKDGLLVIEVPNFKTWTMPLLKARHRHFVQDHLNFFSFETLGKLLDENGFQILDQFHPVRRMSVRHLANCWLPKFLPSSVAYKLQKSLGRTILWEKTIGLNIGDILTIIARKQ